MASTALVKARETADRAQLALRTERSAKRNPLARLGDVVSTQAGAAGAGVLTAVLGESVGGVPTAPALGLVAFGAAVAMRSPTLLNIANGAWAPFSFSKGVQLGNAFRARTGASGAPA